MKKYGWIGLVLVFGCVETFEFENTSTNQFLVVDGSVTNELKNHFVRLLKVNSLDTSDYSPISGAIITIEKGQETSYSLEEVDTGVYATVAEFRGEPGSQYHVEIELPSGQMIVSRPELLPEPVPIDSIYDRYEGVIDKNSNEFDRGIQFFLDANTSASTGYFRYQWEETYEILTPFPSSFYYDAENDEPVAREQQVGECYSFNQSNNILITNVLDNALFNVKEFPIRFIPETEQQLRTRYSIRVEQKAISEEAYNYFRRLKTNNEESGGLFDQQQGTIIGNLYDPDDESEVILGYFEVAGISSRREFFRSTQLDPPFVPPSFLYLCPESEIITTTLDSIKFYFNSDPDLNIYFIELNPFQPPNVFLVDRRCSQCDDYATTQKPDYWIF